MSGDGLLESVKRKEERKLDARERPGRGQWFWVGMFGLVGWSVMIPTLAGIALGALADTARDDEISWTLTGLVLGLLVGCLTAWYWVRKESAGRRGRRRGQGGGE